jgi:D-serine deaminase-like pyridoxal phosphate-dependent protein
VGGIAATERARPATWCHRCGRCGRFDAQDNMPTTAPGRQETSVDEKALAELGRERIDWRFKAMPHTAFGSTADEFLAQEPTLTGAGFAGPVLVLDEQALEHNLRTMRDWCAERGVHLAPHGKTTMAPRLFRRQIEHGAWGITAANVGQLRVYRAFGVRRVLFANQLVDTAGLQWLSAELDGDPEFEFSCWVDSVDGVRVMSEALAPVRPSRPVDVVVELGGPHGRTGARGVEAAIEVARAARESSVLRLVGVGGYEAAMVHGITEDALAAVDDYLAELRELVARLCDDGAFEGLDEILVTCGGSAYFDQVAEALTRPWPAPVPVTPVLRSGAYITHDDGLYRAVSPFGREHRLAGAEQPFRPAMRIWAQVTSRPEPGLALVTMGRRDVSFDQHYPEPQLVRGENGSDRAVTAGECRVTKLADQHAFLEVDPRSGVSVGDWIGFGLSHPCTVFDKWAMVPVVEGNRVVDLVRTFF